MFSWFLKSSGPADQKPQQKKAWRTNILQYCSKPLLPTPLSKWEFTLLPLAVVNQDHYFCYAAGCAGILLRDPGLTAALRLLCPAESQDALRAKILLETGFSQSWDALRAGIILELGCSWSRDVLITAVIVLEPK